MTAAPEEDSEDKAGGFTKATQAIEAKIEDAADHYVRSQCAKAVDVLSGVDKEIDALVAKHPQAVAKWYPSIQKGMVYAILAESHKKQSAHYERLYKKGWGKTVPMDEALRIIERDKPQAIIEVVPKKLRNPRRRMTQTFRFETMPARMLSGLLVLPYRLQSWSYRGIT